MPDPAILGVIADLDGVVYRGETAIATAVEALARWREAGVPACYVTNNATRTPEAFAEKLTAMGVPTEPRGVITSPVATAAYIRERWPNGADVFVVGAPALAAAMEEVGCRVVTKGAAEVVVVGLDRSFTYEKLLMAAQAVLGGAVLIGTNADPQLPVEGTFEPGAGSILAAIATASRATPTVIGKPEPRMIAMALERLGTPKGSTVMIGDQTSTDIVAGQRAGLRSILVTTGVPVDTVTATPDRIVDSLLELF